jgi:hypothetical protein
LHCLTEVQSCRLSPVAVLEAACMPVAGIHFVGAPPRPSISFLLLVAPTRFWTEFVPTVLRRDDRLDDHIRLCQLRHDTRRNGPRSCLLCHEEGRRVASHRTTSSVIVVAPMTAIIACDVAVEYNELIPTLKSPPSTSEILLRSRARRTWRLGL